VQIGVIDPIDRPRPTDSSVELAGGKPDCPTNILHIEGLSLLRRIGFSADSGVLRRNWLIVAPTRNSRGRGQRFAIRWLEEKIAAVHDAGVLLALRRGTRCCVSCKQRVCLFPDATTRAWSTVNSESLSSRSRLIAIQNFTGSWLIIFFVDHIFTYLSHSSELPQASKISERSFT